MNPTRRIIIPLIIPLAGCVARITRCRVRCLNFSLRSYLIGCAVGIRQNRRDTSMRSAIGAANDDCEMARENFDHG